MRLNLLSPLLFLAGATLSLASPSYGQYGNVWLNENEALVIKAVTELFVNKNAAVVDKYWSPNYTQHNPGIPNGLAPLRNLSAFLGRFTYETGLIVSSGPIVALRSRLTPEKGNASVIVDIFRIEGGKIAEHWDVIQQEVPVNQTVSGLPMFDPKEKFSYNLSSCWGDAPTRNLLLAPWGLKQLFSKADVKALDKFWDPTYLQHNPGFGSGTAALRPFIVFLATNGGIVFETGFSLSKCDIAFVHSRSAGSGIVVDTFRFREGRFVEHWDIIQTEVPKNQSANGNAMFDPEEFSLQFAY